jgi:hypothetical protein
MTNASMSAKHHPGAAFGKYITYFCKRAVNKCVHIWQLLMFDRKEGEFFVMKGMKKWFDQNVSLELLSS